MSKLPVAEIRKRFESSTEFNEIFDAFQQAIDQRLDDMELYRLLFWNHTLTPPELCLFGEKLAKDFPVLAYDAYMWLANVFEVTYAMYDNYELALDYYRKAADCRPGDPAPYTEAAECYEPDLSIPPLNHLVEFLKQGATRVKERRTIYERLAYFYDLLGNDEMSMYYRRKLEEDQHPPSHPEDPPSSR